MDNNAKQFFMDDPEVREVRKILWLDIAGDIMDEYCKMCPSLDAHRREYNLWAIDLIEKAITFNQIPDHKYCRDYLDKIYKDYNYRKVVVKEHEDSNFLW